MERPKPLTPPVTITFLFRSSMSAFQSPAAQHAFDIAHADHGNDFIHRQFDSERLLDGSDKLHVPHGIPCLNFLHREGVPDLQSGNVQDINQYRLNFFLHLCCWAATTSSAGMRRPLAKFALAIRREILRPRGAFGFGQFIIPFPVQNPATKASRAGAA